MHKKIIFLTILALTVSETSIVLADNSLCPEQIVCGSDFDINSCHCQTNNTNLNDWYPSLPDESHIYQGTYVFHNAQVSVTPTATSTKTYCMQEYTNPHADDKMLCVYKGGNLVPNLYNPLSQWKIDTDDDTTIYYCGDFNYGTNRNACAFVSLTPDLAKMMLKNNSKSK